MFWVLQTLFRANTRVFWVLQTLFRCQYACVLGVANAFQGQYECCIGGCNCFLMALRMLYWGYNRFLMALRMLYWGCKRFLMALRILFWGLYPLNDLTHTTQLLVESADGQAHDVVKRALDAAHTHKANPLLYAVRASLVEGAEAVDVEGDFGFG